MSNAMRPNQSVDRVVKERGIAHTGQILSRYVVAKPS